MANFLGVCQPAFGLHHCKMIQLSMVSSALRQMRLLCPRVSCMRTMAHPTSTKSITTYVSSTTHRGFTHLKTLTGGYESLLHPTVGHASVDCLCHIPRHCTSYSIQTTRSLTSTTRLCQPPPQNVQTNVHPETPVQSPDSEQIRNMFGAPRPAPPSRVPVPGIPSKDKHGGELVYAYTKVRKTLKQIHMCTGLSTLLIGSVMFATASEGIVLSWTYLVWPFLFFVPLSLNYFLLWRIIFSMYYNPKTNVFSATKVGYLKGERVTQFSPEDVTYCDHQKTQLKKFQVKGEMFYLVPNADLNDSQVLRKLILNKKAL